MAFRDLTTRSQTWMLAAAIALGVSGAASVGAEAAPLAPASALVQDAQPDVVPVQYGWGGGHRHHHHHRGYGWGGGHRGDGWGGHRGRGWGGHHGGWRGHHHHRGHDGYGYGRRRDYY
ncbi:MULTISPECIES: hypothetical protein [unclassified Methylobacterium]|uniref:hypothetical protein n=1 Tax=unclassified Methylobacterium TaxID=2615210 RepID=UPI000A6FFA8F|nr:MULTISPECIES: hypothetical protein [unclassified Methylobacterium]